MWWIERVRIVRDEHDGRVAVDRAAVVDDLQVGCGRARLENGRSRFEQRSRLRVAVVRLKNGVAVDAE